MKVLVKKHPDGVRSYLCTRTVGDNKVAFQFFLPGGRKLSEADVRAAREDLDVKLMRRMRMLTGQVNPGEEG